MDRLQRWIRVVGEHVLGGIGALAGVVKHHVASSSDALDLELAMGSVVWYLCVCCLWSVVLFCFLLCIDVCGWGGFSWKEGGIRALFVGKGGQSGTIDWLNAFAAFPA